MVAAVGEHKTSWEGRLYSPATPPSLLPWASWTGSPSAPRQIPRRSPRIVKIPLVHQLFRLSLLRLPSCLGRIPRLSRLPRRAFDRLPDLLDFCHHLGVARRRSIAAGAQRAQPLLEIVVAAQERSEQGMSGPIKPIDARKRDTRTEVMRATNILVLANESTRGPWRGCRRCLCRPMCAK